MVQDSLTTNRLLEQLLANTPDVVFFKDCQSRYIECNETLLRLTGVPREVILGSNTSTFLPPAITEQIIREDRKVLESRKPMRSEQWVEFADGTLALMDTIIAPIIDEHGEAVGLLGIGRDITSLMNTTLALKEKNDALEAANRDLDALMYHASHDLRAPLLSMLGLIEVMRKERDPEKLSNMFDIQEERIRKMDHFIQDIVTLGKNARLGLKMEPIDLESVFQELIDEFRFLPGAPLTDFQFAQTGEARLYSDPFRLKLVLGNLVSNALRYYDPEKERSILRLHSHIEHDKGILNLVDNGIGISEAHVDRIFEMFYRANNSSKGSGIGLYITRETLQKIGGTIRVASTVGIGSTFTIELPNFHPKSA